jgi:hypothetical protein
VSISSLAKCLDSKPLKFYVRNIKIFAKSLNAAVFKVGHCPSLKLTHDHAKLPNPLMPSISLGFTTLALIVEILVGFPTKIPRYGGFFLLKIRTKKKFAKARNLRQF